ncbi:MAG: 2-isopropylmalate synthase [Cyanobacteria bacterium J06650_10]
MLTNPSDKYSPFAPINSSEPPQKQPYQRTWPNNTINTAPVWLSTDLRDGNQALIQPMDIARKLRLFRTLIDIGFKEIEIGFPSASQTEFDFTRHLIEHRLIPDDVTIQVLTPARETLIYRTFQALQGAKQAIVHVYNATAPVFREVVFNLDKPGTIRLATEAATLIKKLASQQPDTHWRFQYSPEVFTSTELSFSKEICNAVLNIWQPTPTAKAIINLPASVEVSTPNVFADQVEWMHRQLNYRSEVVLCVHPHNDRGWSVAAAELAQMAGAERVEGCLFGNGERTGNVDLVTLAMNLYTQGISPKLDFSQIDEIIRIAQDCTQLPVHPRHPYAGELVFTAFSGSHQDAIKKGFAARLSQTSKEKESSSWNIPYLPMDPADVGRSYESVVRVNSQSGKGGIAFLLERDYGFSLPRKLQIEFSRTVQSAVETSRAEVTAQTLWQIFCQTYQQETAPLQYLSHQSSELKNSQTELFTQLRYCIENDPVTIAVTASGKGPIDAFINALNTVEALTCFENIRLSHYEERSLKNSQTSYSRTSHNPINHSLNNGQTNSSDSQAICLVEVKTQYGSVFGLGIHQSIVIASFQAILSALNRQLVAIKDETTFLNIGNKQTLA